MMTFKQIFYDKVDRKYLQNAKYAFLIHPRDLDDCRNNYQLGKQVEDQELEEIAKNSDPVIVGPIFNDGYIEGIFVSALFGPTLMSTDVQLVREKIKGAARYIKELGFNYLGTGGLSAALSRYCMDFLDIEGLIPTTGHALTAVCLEGGISRIKQELDLENPLVSVVGAMGSVGSLLSKRLMEAEYRTLLIDLPYKEDALRKFCKDNKLSSYSVKLGSINDSDIIVTVTNNVRTLIDIDKVDSGKILIDDAQPWCWERFKACERFRLRGDILPLEGGLLTTEDKRIVQGIDTKLINDSDFFCCLGEVLLLSKYARHLKPVINKNYNGNLIERLKVSDEYKSVANEEGFILAPYQCGYHQYTPDEISAFRKFIESL